MHSEPGSVKSGSYRFLKKRSRAFQWKKRVHWNGLPRYGIMSGEITFSIKVAPRINFRPF